MMDSNMPSDTTELRLQDRTILIVDDDREVQESIDQALQAEGALCRFVEMAIQQYASVKPIPRSWLCWT